MPERFNDNLKRMMTTETKQCGGCGNQLPLSEFYRIRSSDESTERLEKICKRCKKGRRKTRGQQSQSVELPSNPPKNSKTEPRIRDDGEIIYREYVYPNGETLQLTKEEFDRVVDLFRMLDKQDRKINGPPK